MNLRPAQPACLPGLRQMTRLALLLAAAVSAAPSDSSAPGGAADFARFQVITQRNIFDSRRGPAAVRAEDTNKQAAPAPTVTLVGTMLYEQGEGGPYAFFDGSAPEYRQVLQPGGSLAGCKVIAVSTSGIALQAGDETFNLPVGGQLRREEEGRWILAAAPAPAKAADSHPGDVPGEDSDIVKRLMQQREQELK